LRQDREHAEYGLASPGDPITLPIQLLRAQAQAKLFFVKRISPTSRSTVSAFAQARFWRPVTIKFL
jgi:hypothetical protein